MNPLRHSTTHLIDNRGLEDLRRLGSALGFDAARDRRRRLGDVKASVGTDTDGEYSFGGMRFERSDAFGIRTVGNKRDVEENLQQI